MMMPEPSPFAAVSRNLSGIGAMSLQEYLTSPLDKCEFQLDIAHYNGTGVPSTKIDENSMVYKSCQQPSNETPSIAQLQQVCRRAFGSTDMLQYEFMKDEGPDSHQCIITISRPSGIQRSYTTRPIFQTKSDAKTTAAEIAIDMGALDFITNGEADITEEKGLVLAPLDVEPDRNTLPCEVAESPGVKRVEEACLHWRGGQVVPEWFLLSGPKLAQQNFGFALRVKLSPNVMRVFSVETSHDSPGAAKESCANVAIEHGILDFIRLGNDQTEPSLSPDTTLASNEDLTRPLTLQQYFDSLPRPFTEECLKDKTFVTEINGPSWLNVTLQSAAGARFQATFTWLSEEGFGLHGCLLRVKRPDEVRSYLVDARFHKRADAKAAVCLHAMTQGLGDSIRQVRKSIESKVTPAMTQWVKDHVLDALTSELRKIRPGAQLMYTFEKDHDAFGCSLTLDLTPIAPHSRIFSVETEYRNKADALTALRYQAAKDGAIEFLRFRGKSPPIGFVSAFTEYNAETNRGESSSTKKRKDPRHLWTDVSTSKRHKAQRAEDDLLSFETHAHALLQKGNRHASSVHNHTELQRPGSSDTLLKKQTAVGSQLISHVAALIEHCTRENLAQPTFYKKEVSNDDGKKVFKVWLVLAKERLELPVTYVDVNQGRERVAKQVLARIRKARTVKTVFE